MTEQPSAAVPEFDLPDRTPYLLAVIGTELWRACLVGNPAPAVARLGKRMREPQPGDLVLEISRFDRLNPERFDPDSVGRLIRVEGDRWVVGPFNRPGVEQGWRNAMFIALPDQPKWLGE